MRKSVHLSIVLLLTLSLALSLAGCSLFARTPAAGIPEDKISIVATIFPQYDFARAIVGDKADLAMLVSPGAEIHSYDPSPADIIKIKDSDVFIYVGGESEVWVDTILSSMDTSGMKLVRLMDSITPVEEEIVEGMQEDEHEHGSEGKEEHEGEGHEDEEKHEDEKDHEEDPEYDEHIWTSPKNAVLMINAIAEAICGADPDNAAAYRQNAAVYVEDIEKLDKEIREIVDAAGKKLVVFGDRFPFRYFTDEFGLEYRAAFNGCSTESEASAATIAHLIKTVKENGLSHVFYIELSNQNIARSISEQTGAETLLLHSCQTVSRDEFEAGATYLSIMEQNAQNLRKGLN